MAKAASSIVLNGSLDILRLQATKMTACAGQPANSCQASSANMLASVALTTASDIALSGASSRIGTVAAKSGVTITNTGVADHIAIFSTVTASSLVLFVTTCSSQSLSSGGTVDFPAWTVSLEQPA